jgi:hypothetical protein
MKIRLAAAFFAMTITLVACSDSSSPTSTESNSGRMEVGLLGTWIKDPPSVLPDSLYFAENKIEVPFFSGIGSAFTAKDGLVKCGPSLEIYGEYLRFGDTLYYDVLFGSAPNGVDKAKAKRYLKKVP